MPHWKILDPILEDWLPTKWSRLTVVATIILTPCATRLPEFLLLLGIRLPEIRKLLPQIIGPVTILFLGTFIVLLQVVLHYKSKKTDDGSLPTKSLSDDSIEILRMIAVFEPSSLDNPYCSIPFNELATAKNLGHTAQQIRYHVDQLYAAKCVYLSVEKNVSLSPKGRALLHEKGLLC